MVSLESRATALLPELVAKCGMTQAEGQALEGDVRSFSQYTNSFSRASKDTRLFLKEQARSLVPFGLDIPPSLAGASSNYDLSKVEGWAVEGANRARELSQKYSRAFSRLDKDDPEHEKLMGQLNGLISDGCTAAFGDDAEVSNAGSSSYESSIADSASSAWSSNGTSDASRMTPTSVPVSKGWPASTTGFSSCAPSTSCSNASVSVAA